MPGENGNGRSPLDEVRALYAAQLDTGPLYVPVGRKAKGRLVVAYNEQGWEETKESRKRWADSNEPRAELFHYAEVLAKSCRDIWVRDDEHGQVLRNAGDTEPLAGKYLPGLGEGRGAMSFHAAAVSLGLPVGDEDPLTAVFALLASDWEIEFHHRVLTSWDPDTLAPESEERLVGESVPVGLPAT